MRQFKLSARQDGTAGATRHWAAHWVAGMALAAALVLAAPFSAAALAGDVTHVKVANVGISQQLAIGLNKSVIVDLPVDAQEVIVSQPGVANAVLRTKRRAIVQAVAAGDTNMFFLDAAGRTIVVFDLSVKYAQSTVASALTDTLRRLLPQSNISVESVALVDDGGKSTSRIVLSGTAANTDDANKAMTIAAQFAGKPENVASVIQISGPQQVALKVTVAEVQRTAVKQFGINLDASYSAGGLTTGFVSAPPLGNASGVDNPNSATISAKAGGLSIEATLQSLERQGALRTLAAPTLTALSGQEAEFLVGGELPYTTTDSSGATSTVFKEYGVKLTFTPTIKSGNIIGLAVDTSVSEPSSDGSGALTTRQAKTNVELGAGQTLSIGGLMQDTVRTQINRVPGLGDIPILGTLFRSRDYIHNQTELLVLVTPVYAQAGPAPTLPTDKMQLANDAEATFLGHIENVYGVGTKGMRGGYDGSVGFLLD